MLNGHRVRLVTNFNKQGRWQGVLLGRDDPQRRNRDEQYHSSRFSRSTAREKRRSCQHHVEQSDILRNTADQLSQGNFGQALDAPD